MKNFENIESPELFEQFSECMKMAEQESELQEIMEMEENLGFEDLRTTTKED